MITLFSIFGLTFLLAIVKLPHPAFCIKYNTTAWNMRAAHIYFEKKVNQC